MNSYHYHLQQSIYSKKGQAVLKDIRNRIEAISDKKLSPLQFSSEVDKFIGTIYIGRYFKQEIFRVNNLYVKGDLVETKEARWKRMRAWVRDHLQCEMQFKDKVRCFQSK